MFCDFNMLETGVRNTIRMLFLVIQVLLKASCAQCGVEIPLYLMLMFAIQHGIIAVSIRWNWRL